MLETFGTTAAGEAVQAVTLAAGGLRVRVLSLGAIVQSVRLSGVAHDLTVGSGDLAAYEGPLRYHGAVVGPVANRISGAAARIGGRLHRFEDTGGGVTLHGGRTGVHARLWRIAEAGPAQAVLELDLPDGDGGFPGNRRLTAAFTVAAPAVLRLRLAATTDAPTLMNLANHSYWNLDGTPTWEGHRLSVAADRVLVHHPDGRVAGGPVAVEGGPLDLRAGAVLRPGAPALDHNFCLAPAPRPLAPAADLRGRSGVRLQLATTAPGLQVYDGRPGHAGLALEPQCWPDAPAHPGFPPISLDPGQVWEQVSEWRFGRD